MFRNSKFNYYSIMLFILMQPFRVYNLSLKIEFDKSSVVVGEYLTVFCRISDITNKKLANFFFCPFSKDIYCFENCDNVCEEYQSCSEKQINTSKYSCQMENLNIKSRTYKYTIKISELITEGNDYIKYTCKYERLLKSKEIRVMRNAIPSSKVNIVRPTTSTSSTKVVHKTTSSTVKSTESVTNKRTNDKTNGQKESVTNKRTNDKTNGQKEEPPIGLRIIILLSLGGILIMSVLFNLVCCLVLIINKCTKKRNERAHCGMDKERRQSLTDYTNNNATNMPLPVRPGYFLTPLNNYQPSTLNQSQVMRTQSQPCIRCSNKEPALLPSELSTPLNNNNININNSTNSEYEQSSILTGNNTPLFPPQNSLYRNSVYHDKAMHWNNPPNILPTHYFVQNSPVPQHFNEPSPSNNRQQPMNEIVTDISSKQI